MLSLTFLVHTTQFQLPYLFPVQPLISSKPRSRVKLETNSSSNPSNLPCFSRREPSHNTTHLVNRHVSSSIEKQDHDSSDLPLIYQFVDPNVLALWLQCCCTVKDVRRLHAFSLKYLGNSVTFINNNLVSSYLKFGKLIEARKVFEKMPSQNVVSWTTVISGYMRFGLEEEALSLFKESIDNGVRANHKTFVCVLKLCSKKIETHLGRQIHACIVKGNWRNLIVDSAIVYFYAQCDDLSDAFRAFGRMPERDVVSWTTMITACSQQGHIEEAVLLFSDMLSHGFSPNEVTLCSVLKACGEKRDLKFGRQLHSSIVKKIVKDDVFIGSSLVDMYAKCGKIIDSRKVFDLMGKRNTVTWTSIIAGYAQNGMGQEAITLFRLMRTRKVLSNSLTIVSILSACGSVEALQTGKEIHAQVIKNSASSNIHIGSTLIWFYCKCKSYFYASNVLQTMPARDVVSWTAIISGCTRLGHESEALEFLKIMLREGIEPNPYTYSSSLKACAKLKAIIHGKSIHSFVNKTASFSNVVVGSSLINMYSKCGYVNEAVRVFNGMKERNLVSWKAMILCYARNGQCKEALQIMYRMKAEGVEIDDYIHSTVLSACGDSEWNVEISSEVLLQ